MLGSERGHNPLSLHSDAPVHASVPPASLKISRRPVNSSATDPMTTTEMTVRWIAVSILAGYLALKYWQRAHTRSIRPDCSHLTGRAVDAAPLQSRIQRLRHDYVAELHSTSRSASFRDALVARARRTLSCLPFFRVRMSEHENQNPPS